MSKIYCKDTESSCFATKFQLKEQKIACAAENDLTTVIDWLCEL